MGQKNKIDQSNVYEKLKFRSFWKPELKDDYISAFSNEDIIKSYINLVSIQPVGPHTTQDQVDNLTTELSNIYLEPAKRLDFVKKYQKVDDNLEKTLKNHGLIIFAQTRENCL